ncbi:(2Fe-2S)-binding protein [Rossellomorea marisflavi]|uniref:(2Fe-2S)-binding protein n=1 Tax=Rossellomorea marisflavi TaxID=189381 RepID=UPI0027A2FD68|nr:(2Fe-2S)-binding protein [Rossellomorea marisflavi]UTE73801.1 (2Fe-2S)-binding protein [Rossellomorea marisflavi]
MPKLRVIGYGEFTIKKGTKLVLALEDNDVDILHRCGGNARCTTCRVEIHDGDFCDLSSGETEMTYEDRLRLSCQIRVEGDATVRPVLTVESTGKKPGPRPAD